MSGMEDVLLKNTGNTAKRIIELIQNYDFDSFLIGIRLPEGVEDPERLKKKLASDIGRIVSSKLGRRVDFSKPDVTIIVDYRRDALKPSLELDIRSLYIYGEYQKLERDIPQTKWICMKCRGKGCPHCHFMGKLYPTSVEEEIGKVLLDATGGRGTKFHGAGREDRDALMLGWRPFVIEIIQPVVRKLDLKEIEEKINKSSDKVKVRNLRYSSKDEVVELKNAKYDKTYEVLVECPGYSGEDLKKIEDYFKDLEISQRTPTRVAHRRADKIRKRAVRYVTCEKVDDNHFKARIRAESGTYIKELVSGDEGRTKPSFSEIIGKPCKVIELNVLEVHKV